MKKILPSLLVMLVTLQLWAQPAVTLSKDTVKIVVSSLGTNSSSFTISNSGDATLNLNGFQQLNQYSTGEPVTFAKPNNSSWLLPSNQDKVSDEVWITRDLTKSLFNAKRETASTSASPDLTTWALGTLNENAESTYVTFTAVHNNNPQSLIGAKATMKVLSTKGLDPVYYTVVFKTYVGGMGGGGFSYERRKMMKFYELGETTSVLAPGEEYQISVNVTDGGLAKGKHYGKVQFSTNDSAAPLVDVVVELTVLSAPEISVSKTSIYAEVANDNGSITDSFIISNAGGSALDWYGNQDAKGSMCASLNNYGGTIQAGESQEVTITFDPCTDGTYEWPFKIYSNDAKHQETVITFKTLVEGTATLSHFWVDFNPTFEGATSTKNLKIESIGSGTLHISSITSSNPVFVPTQTSLQISAESFVNVPIRFSPTSQTEYTGELLIVSDNAQEDSLYITITGTGATAPVLNVTPNSLSFSVNEGETKRDSVKVTTSGATLFWNYIVKAQASFSEGVFYEKKNYGDIDLEQNRDRITPTFHLVRGDNGPPYNYLDQEIMFAMGSAANLEAEDYVSSFQNATDDGGSSLPGKILSIYLPEENRFFDLHITTWQPRGDGGGLAYTRYEVFKWLEKVVKTTSSNATFGVDVTYAKGNYADISLTENQDHLTDNVALVRGNNGGLYDYNGHELRYLLGSGASAHSGQYIEFRNALRNNFNLNDLPGHTVSVYIVSENRFFDLDFTSWTCCGNGGGFAYTRREVFPDPQGVYFRKENGSDPEYIGNQDSVMVGVFISRSSEGGITNYGSVPVMFAKGKTLQIQKSDYTSDASQSLNEDFDIPGYVSVYVPSTNQYFDLEFLNWNCCDSYNGYTYVRTEVFPTVQPEEDAYAVVSVTGSVPTGTYSGSFLVQSDDPKSPKSEVTVSTTFAGTPDVAGNLSEYHVENQVVGSTSSFEVPIYNYGLDVLSVSGVTVASGDFTPSATTFTLAAGGVYKLPISFSSQTVGVYTHALTITSNDPDQPELVINLTGEVLNKPIFGIAETIIYDTLAFGTSTTHYVTLLNSGTGTLEWKVGYDTYFEKMDGANPTAMESQDRINDHVWLTRADQKGLYNTLEMDEYNENQETYKWGSSPNPFTSSFGNFDDYYNGNDLYSDAHVAMHMVEDDSYYEFHFLKWTAKSNGGGFAYERRSAAKWLGLNAYSGSISGEGTYELPIVFNAEHTLVGDYELAYTLTTNDPEHPTQLITFKLHVDGHPEINVVNASPIALGTYMVGKTSTPNEKLTIQNLGGDKLEVSLSSDNSVFGFETTHFIIEGDNQLEIPILFTPTDSVDYSGVITITSNDEDESLLTIDVTGTGYFGPKLTLSLDTISATVARGGVASKTLTISNTGAQTLDWSVWDAKVQKKDYADWKLAENQDRISDKVWLTRQDRRNLYNILETTNPNSTTESIMWALGSSKDLDLNSNYSHDFRNIRNQISGRLYNLSGQTVSIYLVEEKRFFDLYFTSWKANGGGGFSYYRREYLPGGFSEYSGSIAVDESQEIAVQLDGTGLDAGTHFKTHYFYSNASNEKVPFVEKITVLGISQVVLPSNTLSFGEAPVGIDTLKEFEISNTGSSLATIALTSNNAAFTFPVSSLSVKVGETKKVSVNFKPSATGSVSGVVTLTTNDPSHPTLSLNVSGSGATPPTILVEKPSLELNLFFGQSVTKSIVITNSGNFDLKWNIDVDASEMNFEKVNYADPKLEANQDRVSKYVWITRGNNKGVFNAVLESKYDNDRDDSPLGTEWNYGTTSESSLTQYGTWNDANDGDPLGMLDNTFSLRDVGDDRYYDILWKKWTSNGLGGGFAYTRTQKLGAEYKAFEISKRNGVLAPGKSETVQVVINKKGAYDGSFALPLAIFSNDPINKKQAMPLSITIEGIIVTNPIANQLVNQGFVSKSIALTGVFADAQNDPLTYTATSSNTSVVTASVVNGEVVLAEVGRGNATITVKAADNTGNSSTNLFDFRVNAVPVVAALPAKSYDINFASATFNLATYVSDADAADMLTYTVSSSNTAVVTAALSGAVVTLTEVGVGTTTISVSVNDGFGGVSNGSFGVTVSKLAQMITFDGTIAKTYGDATFNLVATSSSAKTVSFASSDATVLTISGTTATVVGAGTAVVTASQAGDATYLAAASITKTIVVSKAVLTAKANDASMVFGATQPTYSITYSGFVNGDLASVIDTPSNAASVNSAITGIGVLVISPAQNAVDNNYSFIYQDGSLTVTQASLTVAVSAVAKSYGAADPALTYQITSGSLIGSDALSGSLTRAAGESAGTYAITQGSLTASDNYTLTVTESTLTIGKVAIAVVVDAKVKIYGAADPALTYQITSGSLIGSDALSGSLARAAGESAGTYAITQGTLTAGGNYTLTVTESTLTIGKIAIAVAVDAKVKTYGEADPALTYQITSGSLIGSDALTGSLTRAAGESAGTYAITQGTLTAGDNYSLTVTESTFTVDKVGITITAEAKAKSYGEADPALTHLITSGTLLGSDVITGSLARVQGEDAGVYAITSGSLAISSNYELVYEGANLTIAKALLSAKAEDKSMLQGEAVPTLTISYVGFVLGETESVLDTKPTVATVATGSSPVGTYAITVSDGSDNNYTLQYTEGALTIGAVLGFETDEVLTIYPNPSEKYIMVRSTEHKTLTIFDLNGKAVLSGATDVQLEVQHLSAGIYVVKVGSQMLRLIKQ